jgi:cyclase
VTIFPSIDLKDGRCVRLLRGDFSTVHDVADDPVAVARQFAADGARVIHVVDLDGARDGNRTNADIVRAIVEAVHPVRVELGGGLRGMADIEEVFGWGVWRAVIGSAAVENPEFVRQAAAAYGRRIAVGVDALNGEVKTRGWEQSSGRPVTAFAQDMVSLGVQCLIFTDIMKDGALQGPSLTALKELRHAVPCELIASGGVSSLADISALKETGLDGAIIGKAMYTDHIRLPEALKTAAPKKRIVVAIDCKDGRAVKGVNFTHFRDAGDPVELARRYSEMGADEIVLLDIAASVEGRSTLLDLVRRMVREVDVPFSVSGGIRSADDFAAVLEAGAHRAAIGSAAVKKPQLIAECAKQFGSRRVIVSIDAEWRGDSYEVKTGMGQEHTRLDAIAWAQECERLGAGELLVTSMGADGTGNGFDVALLNRITQLVLIPVTASGGCGSLDDFHAVFTETGCEAALAASVFHFGKLTVSQVKAYLREKGVLP